MWVVFQWSYDKSKWNLDSVHKDHGTAKDRVMTCQSAGRSTKIEPASTVFIDTEGQYRLN